MILKYTKFISEKLQEFLKESVTPTHLFDQDWLSGFKTDGENITLYHYGNPNLKELDPEFWGKNAYTKSESWWGLKRIYFYTDLRDREKMISGELYKVKIPLKDLYPFNKDPLNLLSGCKKDMGYEGKKMPARLEIICISGILKNMGYKGMIYYWDGATGVKSKAAVIWEKVPVKTVNRTQPIPTSDKIGWPIKDGLSTDPALTRKEKIERVADTMRGQGTREHPRYTEIDISKYLLSMN